MGQSPSQPPPSQGEEPIERLNNIENRSAPSPARGRAGVGAFIERGSNRRSILPYGKNIVERQFRFSLHNGA